MCLLRDRERGRISLSIKRLEESLDTRPGRARWRTGIRPRADGRRVLSTSARSLHGEIATPSEVVHSGDLERVRVVAIDPGDVDCLCPYVKRQEMSCTQLGQTKTRTYNRNQMLNAAIYL